jgi:hypothetical protein
MVSLCICFPGQTQVTTKRGGLTRLDQLLVGDQVLTFRDSAKKPKKWTTFYTWGHRETTTVGEFIVFKTEGDGKELQISPDHLLFVGQNGRRVVKRACEVKQGESNSQIVFFAWAFFARPSY